MAHSRTPTQNTAGDGFPAIHHHSPSIRVPGQVPNSPVIEVTYNL